MFNETLEQDTKQVEVGQIWAHESGNHYEVAIVGDDSAHCYVLSVYGKAITDLYRRPLICKFSIDSLAELTLTTRPTRTRPLFAYKRPRHPVKALKRLIRRFIRRIRRNSRRIARIMAQVTISGSLIAVGIIAGLTIVGLLCVFCGICLASCQEDRQTPEEYRQAVVNHFQARGKQAPRWTKRGAK